MTLSSIAAPAEWTVEWRELPALPLALGGQFVGVIDDRLVVAGGTYFVTPPWDGGKKIWVDRIYTLERGATQWKLAGHLPTNLAYGAAIPVPHGLLLIGGQTGDAPPATNLKLTLIGDQVRIDSIPPLPASSSMFAAALLNGRIYVAGGQAAPSSTHASSGFLSSGLLSSTDSGDWSTLESWPGPPRILPAMAALGDAIYLVSGAELTGQPGPPVGRRFLTDAFRYRPGRGWEKLPSVPVPVQAGLPLGWEGRLLIFGGNDGTLADREYELKEKHPGFSKDVLSFDPQTMKWSRIGAMPYSLVTTGITRWGNEWVIAGGEEHPAFRSAKVIAGHLR